MSDSSDQHEVHAGTVLWYRPEKGQGAVKADSGRHFRFEKTEGINDVVKGLRVLVRVDTSTRPPSVVVLPLPGGKREYAAVEPVKPKSSTRATPATSSRRKAPSSSRKPATPVGSGRRSSRRVAAPKKKLPNGAFQVGTAVRHETHGQGFVVLSTRSITRVKFMSYGEERQVKTADLKSLESSR
jgi:cold shock CspA family protein